MLGLVDVADLAVRLGYQTDDLHLMGQLQVAIADVGAAIETYCQTSFQPTSSTRLYNGTDIATLSLKDFTRTVSAVRVDYGDGVFVALTGWALQPSNPRRKDGAGNPLFTYIVLKPSADILVFPHGVANIEVTGTFGMTKLPAQVVAALAMGVRHWFNLRDYDETKAVNSGTGRLIEEAIDVDYLPTAARNLLSTYVYRGFDNS